MVHNGIEWYKMILNDPKWCWIIQNNANDS